MDDTILIVLLVPTLILAIISNIRNRRERMKRLLKREWGAQNVLREMDKDTLEEIARLYNQKPKHGSSCERIDHITWNDLEMDAIYRKLNRTQSNAGEETLYAILHEIDVDDTTLERRDRWMQALSHDDKRRMALQTQLNKLGRDHSHNAFSFLNNPKGSVPRNEWIYYSLAVLPIVFLILGFVNPYFFAGIAVSFLINTIVHYRTRVIWGAEQAAIRQLAGVVRCGRKLLQYKAEGMEDGFTILEDLCLKMRPIMRWNGLYVMQRVNDYDMLTDYFRIAFQLDMISLIQLSRFLQRNKEMVYRAYLLVGEIDVCIAIASVRSSLKQYAVPQFVYGSQIEAKEVVHPLLREPVSNSIDWMENVLITGSNASGKSTFVKAIAINAILAQSICTCWAQSLSMPRAQVISSMAIRDNLQDGESYFIVEIKSLKRIIAAIREDKLTLCFIDEILRGTNTVERIASSSSLLRYLSGQNVLCIAATHDMELTQLLTEYRKLHFQEEITSQGMDFSYQIMEGISNTRNAIRLMEQAEFPSQVIASAYEEASVFDATGKWK